MAQYFIIRHIAWNFALIILQKNNFGVWYAKCTVDFFLFLRPVCVGFKSMLLLLVHSKRIHTYFYPSSWILVLNSNFSRAYTPSVKKLETLIKLWIYTWTLFNITQEVHNWKSTLLSIHRVPCDTFRVDCIIECVHLKSIDWLVSCVLLSWFFGLWGWRFKSTRNHSIGTVWAHLQWE